MSNHRITRGNIPNLGGEAAEATKGWLRISPDITDSPQTSRYHLPPEMFEGEYFAVPIDIVFSEIDTNPDNFAQLSFLAGEHPLSFRGRTILEGVGYIATGIHYRSGFYSGNVELSPEGPLQTQEPVA
jgi:hypothetical protein